MPSPRAPLAGNWAPNSTGNAALVGAMGNDVVAAAVTFTLRTIDAWVEMTNLKNHNHGVLT